MGGSADRYDAELRPELMLRAIHELQNGGVEADIWKIEGIDDREACNEIAKLARREGRDRVSCVVLGRGASDEKVDEWLRAGAGIEGYIGFAIGRSIFAESVKAYAADPDGFDRDAAVEKIARNYLRFIEVYEGAPAPRREPERRRARSAACALLARDSPLRSDRICQRPFGD